MGLVYAALDLAQVLGAIGIIGGLVALVIALGGDPPVH